MNRPAVEVADILRAVGKPFIERHRSWLQFQQLKVMRAISRCRTAARGGHIDKCLHCGKDLGISFNSCRDRHCPKCQAQSRQRWIEARQNELFGTSLCVVPRYVVYATERSARNPTGAWKHHIKSDNRTRFTQFKEVRYVR